MKKHIYIERESRNQKKQTILIHKHTFYLVENIVLIQFKSMCKCLFSICIKSFLSTLIVLTVMMTITIEDYETQYWPKLEGAIDQLLSMTPGQYIPISYEQMYRSVSCYQNQG